DESLPRPAARQSRRRPAHSPHAHHRDRQQELALQARAHPKQTTKKSSSMSGPRRAPAPPSAYGSAPKRQRGARPAMKRKPENPTAGGATSSRRRGASASRRA